MPVTRYLGAGWAAVHGPTDARALAVAVLDQGFRGLLPGPAARPVDWQGLRALSREMGFGLGGTWRLAAQTEAEDRPDRGLGSRNRGDVASAVTAIRGAIDRARRLGLSRLILEPGAVRMPGEAGPLDLADSDLGWTLDRARAQAARRDALLDAALDVACRALHGIGREHPEIELCLNASRTVDGIGTLRGLEAVFEDLSSQRLGYWHEAAITACRMDRLGEPQGAWLERFAGRMRGLTVSDWADGRLHLPPGSGLVDYPLVANYVPVATGSFPVVVDLDPGVSPGEIPGVHSFLDKFGL